jgi:DNA (cytosine-5)-methyltransferase 1
MRIGSLFSGIGGLELGLEWAGVGNTVWQVESNLFCQKVLAKHWPDAQRFDNVRDVGVHNLSPVDVICGGFPCTDVSLLGKRAGIAADTRSGLWIEFARIVGEMLPPYLIVENTRGLETLGLAGVLTDLRSLGYRGERIRISARDVGADHDRARTFVLAHADRKLVGSNGTTAKIKTLVVGGCHQRERAAANVGWQLWPMDRPRVLGSLNGVPYGVDRNRSLGNAVVPSVAEVIGRRIVQHHAAVARAS